MQNFKNHARYYPLHHFVLMPLTLVVFIWTLKKLFSEGANLSEQLYFLLVALSLLLVSVIARMYANKNQDRIIRMEMRLRYFELTGQSFRKKESQLRLSQLIALRFASDEELVALLEKAIAEKLSAKDIKASIQNWQADDYRV